MSNLQIESAIDALVIAAHNNSARHGFWESEHLSPTDYKLSRIALMMSELGEAVNGIRKELNDDHLPQYSMEACEMADTIIRIFDYAGGYGIPLGEVLLAKMDYNATRPYKHNDKA